MEARHLTVPEAAAMQESCIYHGGCRHNCNLPLAIIMCQVLNFTILAY
jgi:hypothetical protein